FDMVEAGLRGFKARHQLALAQLGQGRPAEAEVQWRRALAERPDFMPAWRGLGDLFLGQERWGGRGGVAIRLEAGSREAGEPLINVGLLRARAFRARGELAAALQILRDVCAQAPKALAPRVLLSQVLVEEGRDWQAAESALRDVLTLDP